MCAFLQANADTFSASAQSQIASHLATRTCLDDEDDGGGGPGNNAPVLDPIGPQTVQEEQQLTVVLSANDADGDTLDYSVTPTPPGASLVGDTFTYTPPDGTVPGGSSSVDVSVTFSVDDNNGGQDSEAVVITVTRNNVAPDLQDPGSDNATEGILYTLQLQATDIDLDPITFSSSNLPAGAVLDEGTGLFSWKPAGNQSGVYAIQFNARDNFGASDTETLNLTVADNPGVPSMPSNHIWGDFTATSKAHFSVFRNPSGDWFYADEDSLALGSYGTQQWGLSGDLAVPHDYDGDKVTDFAVFRPSESVWYVLYSGTGVSTTFAFGLDGDLPAPADYDGDGRADLAIYRPSLSMYIYRPSSSPTSNTLISVGARGDIPVPCDYDGDGEDEVALFKPSDGSWTIVDGGQQTFYLGSRADIPVPGDYDGDGSCERSVWEPSTGNWRTDSSTTQWGLPGDVPVPADYDGDGDIDRVVFRPSFALWYLRNDSGGAEVYQLGLPTDLLPLKESYYYASRKSKNGFAFARVEESTQVHVFRNSAQALFSFGLSTVTSKSVAASAGSYILRGDYDADGLEDKAVYAGGVWVFYYATGGTGSALWGVASDIPVSGDFDGDGVSDIGIYRPDDGGGYSTWYIIKSSDGLALVRSYGLFGDVPVPADFNGDGWTDQAVWRPSLGMWFIADGRTGVSIEATQWGLFGDYSTPADFDNDGRADKVIWRPLDGNWYVNSSGGEVTVTQYGLSGDVPVPGRYVSLLSVDFAVYRPSTATFYVLTQTGAAFQLPTGLFSTDQVVAALPLTPVQ